MKTTKNPALEALEKGLAAQKAANAAERKARADIAIDKEMTLNQAISATLRAGYQQKKV